MTLNNSDISVFGFSCTISQSLTTDVYQSYIGLARDYILIPLAYNMDGRRQPSPGLFQDLARASDALKDMQAKVEIDSSDPPMAANGFPPMMFGAGGPM